MFEGIKGTLAHDCFAPYNSLKDAEHALCNAHILRELLAAEENEGARWAKVAKRLPLNAYRLHKRAGDAPPDPKKALAIATMLKKLLLRTDKECEEKRIAQTAQKPKRGKPKRTKAHNLARRLLEKFDDWLRFLFDPAAPFTNNQAERDLKHDKSQNEGKRMLSHAARRPILRPAQRILLHRREKRPKPLPSPPPSPRSVDRNDGVVGGVSSYEKEAGFDRAEGQRS